MSTSLREDFPIQIVHEARSATFPSACRVGKLYNQCCASEWGKDIAWEVPHMYIKNQMVVHRGYSKIHGHLPPNSNLHACTFQGHTRGSRDNTKDSSSMPFSRGVHDTYIVGAGA